MPVFINFKICDNAEECLGIEVCNTGALYWDGKKKSIVIDNLKCTDCGLCEEACEVHAIRVARNDKECKKIEKEIDNDPRKVADLFIDRYGATPIHPAFQMKEDQFEKEILRSVKLTALEIYNEDTIECLLNSIAIKDLFKDKDIKFRKLIVKDRNLIKKYKIKKLPALLFFNAGKLINKIQGFYSIKQKKELTDKVNNIIN